MHLDINLYSNAKIKMFWLVTLTLLNVNYKKTMKNQRRFFASALISINMIFKRIVLPIDPLERFVQVLQWLVRTFTIKIISK